MATLEDTLAVSLKVNHKIYSTSYPRVPPRKQQTFPQQLLHNDHSSIICNNQKLETTIIHQPVNELNISCGPSMQEYLRQKEVLIPTTTWINLKTAC